MALSKIDVANMVENEMPQANIANNINFRNIIINGDMSIAQRATSTSSITGNGYHTVDRFQTIVSGLGTWTQSQSTDVPTGQGFATSLKMDCTTADASPASGDNLYIRQKIEGQNLQYLKKGTSSAESLTCSFWVKSNKTGTAQVNLVDEDNSRLNGRKYTISSANTWEKKTLTFDGDTSGVFTNDNGTSLRLEFWLDAGSDYTSGTTPTSWQSNTSADQFAGCTLALADNTANEWYITGVQLEAGTSASDFEFLPVDVNLERCKRYYQLLDGGDATSAISVAASYSTTTAYSILSLNPEMRTQPSIDQVTGTDYFAYLNAGNTRTFDSFAGSTGNSTNKFMRINNADDLSTNTTAGQSGWIKTDNTSAYLAFDAEL
jgi:hypothetical protein